jgi:hypothetical protein
VPETDGAPGAWRSGKRGLPELRLATAGKDGELGSAAPGCEGRSVVAGKSAGGMVGGGAGTSEEADVVGVAGGRLRVER